MTSNFRWIWRHPLTGHGRVACLPGPSPWCDPFKMSRGVTQPERNVMSKGKRPTESDRDKIALSDKPPMKKPKKAGVCRVFNVAPSGRVFHLPL